MNSTVHPGGQDDMSRALECLPDALRGGYVQLVVQMGCDPLAGEECCRRLDLLYYSGRLTTPRGFASSQRHIRKDDR